ncbi:MAG TPA: CBS domain-containing protein [Solirubrobacteraceae bacterium]|nr:CBS domain-containing protein [Solirubrobacteraceae bacterium]
MDDSDTTAERKWPHFGAFLAEAREKAGGGSPVKVSIRDLIWKIEAERRGTRVTDELQRALDRHGLITEPSFTSGWIDNIVELRLATSDSAATSDEKPQSDDGSSSPQPTEIALTVSNLESASSGVVSIERNSDLQRARALMLRHDYSQLAVMSGPRQLVGAISWESMARAAIRERDFTLEDALVQARPVEPGDGLIALIPTIVDLGFVFVVGNDRTLVGIVTTADLSSQFGALAKPFLLIGEIERRLRHALSTRFQVSDLATVQNPDDIARTIKSVNDLTLGETVRFIEREANWQRLCWPVERAEFIKALREVTEIRNDVMHFSPDPMTAIEEAKLHNFVSWLRVMEPRARSVKT